MNYFYAPRENWSGNPVQQVEITGQEAQHISKVLRFKEGDEIVVLDGEGAHRNCRIEQLSKRSVLATVLNEDLEAEPGIKKVLAFGSIKKRDRLEFAIEKAVELGAWEICIFNADRTERSRINEDRLQTQIISAFKQSGRHYLPELVVKDSLDEVFEHYKGHQFYMAHEESDLSDRADQVTLGSSSVLMVGPEGGFSEREVNLQLSKGGRLVNLGSLRLRAETAVAALLANFLFSEADKS